MTHAPRGYWSEPAGASVDAGLQVRVLGEGSRSILLLHGLAGSGRYFGAAFDVLARDAHLLVPDLLGFGRSPRPTDSRYDADAHAGAIAGALDHLDVRGPLYVAAHSAGCLVALRLARLRPAAVHGVLAVSPPFYASPEAARAHVAGLGLLVRWFALHGKLARATCTWMCRHPRAAGQLAEWLRRDLPPEIARDATHHNWTSYSSTVQNLLLDTRSAEDLARIAVPVALVAGESDPVLDLPFLRELARVHPRVELLVWPGGHELPLAVPERIVAEIQRRAAAAL